MRGLVTNSLGMVWPVWLSNGSSGPILNSIGGWAIQKCISGVLGYGEVPFCDLGQQVRFGLNVI